MPTVPTPKPAPLPIDRVDDATALALHSLELIQRIGTMYARQRSILAVHSWLKSATAAHPQLRKILLFEP